jgi:V/A-type H+-transporting ATPase subunit C
MRVAEQAYLRTRLAILNARRRSLYQLQALLELSAEELGAELGIDAGHLDERGLDLFDQSQMQTWLNELNTLLRPLNGAERAVLVQWARRYEVLNIKALVRGKLGGLSRAEIEASLFSLPGFLSLDHEPLLNTDDVMELLRRLKNTPYRQLGMQALRSFEEKQDPFLLDASLDRHFYSGLSARVAQLSEPDRTAMRNLVGRMVDRHNLVWLLRYRHNYRLQPAEALYMSISGGLKLSGSHLRRMLEGATLAEAIEHLPKEMRELVGDAQNLVEVRDVLVRDLQHQAELALRSTHSVLASAFGYLLLRYYEIKSVNAILQARVQHLPEDLLHDALFGMREVA